MMSSSAEILDPRIKGELDRLNTSSAEINRLEKEIDDIRHQFRHTLTESSQRLTETGKKCIKSIQKAHPYHEAKKMERQAHESAQDAALKYQRAVGMFRAAKETIAIAEEASMQGANKKREFDSALQELLNHATSKLNESEKEKLMREKEHEDRSRKYIASQKRVEQLSKKHRKSIAKSADYFALRQSFYTRLEGMKNRMEALQREVAQAKKQYRQALKKLEKISEEIHQSREIEALLAEERSRGVGVGAESESTISDADDEASKRLSLTQLNLDLKNVLAMNEDETSRDGTREAEDQMQQIPDGQPAEEDLYQPSVRIDTEAACATTTSLLTSQEIDRDVEGLEDPPVVGLPIEGIRKLSLVEQSSTGSQNDCSGTATTDVIDGLKPDDDNEIRQEAGEFSPNEMPASSDTAIGDELLIPTDNDRKEIDSERASSEETAIVSNITSPEQVDVLDIRPVNTDGEQLHEEMSSAEGISSCDDDQIATDASSDDAVVDGFQMASEDQKPLSKDLDESSLSAALKAEESNNNVQTDVIPEVKILATVMVNDSGENDVSVEL